MKSDLLKICMASLLALSLTACGGDDSDDGGDDAACKANEKICSNDKLSVMTCKADGSGYDTQKCENGCENGACKADNGGNTKPNPTCKPDVNICSSNGNAVIKYNADCSSFETVQSCSFGCTDGKCDAEKCKQGASKCSDDNSKALTCDANGSWIEADCGVLGCADGACNEADVYEACSAADQKECEDYIAENGADYGYSASDAICVIEDGSPECYVGKCSTIGAADKVCNSKYSAILNRVCMAVGDAGLGIWTAVSIDTECVNGCNEDGLTCAPKLVDDQGETCDPNTYLDKCDANGILSWCGTGNVVKALDCPADDAICDIVDVKYQGETIKYGNCFDTESECSDVGDKGECYIDSRGYAVMSEAYCAPSTTNNSKNYLVEIGEYDCNSGKCEEDKSACVPSDVDKIDDLGEVCDVDKRAAKCTGNAYSYCDDSYVDYGYDAEVAGVDCLAYDYDLCTTVGGKAMCYNTCTEENSVENLCYYDENNEGFVIGTSTCLKDDAGENLVAKKVLTKLCASGCNAAKDGCAYEAEGTACDASTTKESCVDNTAVYCSEGKVGAENCPGLYGENMICYINDSDESYCGESCADDTVGNVVSVCETELFLGFFEMSSQYSKKCVETKDGKKIYKAVEGSEGYCDDQGCNADGTACIAIDDSDY